MLAAESMVWDVTDLAADANVDVASAADETAAEAMDDHEACEAPGTCDIGSTVAVKETYRARRRAVMMMEDRG